MKLDELESELRKRQAGHLRERRVFTWVAAVGALLVLAALWAVYQLLSPSAQ